MIFKIALIGLAIQPANSEKEIKTVFSMSKELSQSFLSNPMKSRSNYENWKEIEFFPAVDKMIDLLTSNQCANCLEPYLESLSHFELSANEELSDQIKSIIQMNSKLLSEACSYSSAEIRRKSSGFMRLAVATLAEEKKISDKEILKKISRCLD